MFKRLGRETAANNNKNDTNFSGFLLLVVGCGGNRAEMLNSC